MNLSYIRWQNALAGCHKLDISAPPPPIIAPIFCVIADVLIETIDWNSKNYALSIQTLYGYISWFKNIFLTRFRSIALEIFLLIKLDFIFDIRLSNFKVVKNYVGSFKIEK